MRMVKLIAGFYCLCLLCWAAPAGAYDQIQLWETNDSPLYSGSNGYSRVYKRGGTYRAYFLKSRSSGHPVDFHVDLEVSRDNFKSSTVYQNVVNSSHTGHTFNYYVAELLEGGVYRFWHMATSDWNIRHPTIYYSTSFNGRSFTSHGQVFADNESYNRWGLKHPVMLKVGSTHYIYYVAYDGYLTPRYVACATSSDGINWTKQGVVLGHSNPTNLVVLHQNGRFEMFYNSRDQGQAMYYAVSGNGLDWDVVGPTGIVGLPAGPVCEDGVYKVWYTTSNGGGNRYLRYATSVEPAPANTPPTVATVGDMQLQYGEEVLLGGQVADIDGDQLTYRWEYDSYTGDYAELKDEALIPGYVIGTDTTQAPADGSPVALPDTPLEGLFLGTHVVSLTVDDGIDPPVSEAMTI